MVHRLEKLEKIRFLNGKIVAILLCFYFDISATLRIVSPSNRLFFKCSYLCTYTYDIVCFEKGKLGCISTLGLFIAEIAEVNYTVM